MQAWQARVFLRRQHSGFAQRRAQCVAERAGQPRAGGLFVTEPGVRGLAETPFAG